MFTTQRIDLFISCGASFQNVPKCPETCQIVSKQTQKAKLPYLPVRPAVFNLTPECFMFCPRLWSQAKHFKFYSFLALRVPS